MFSAGRSDRKQSTIGSRAWLKVGKSFQKENKAEEDEEEEEKGEYVPVVPKEAAIVKETKHLKIEKPKQYVPKPYVVPSKVDKLYEIDRRSDKDNLFYGTLNAIDVPRYHLNKRKSRDPDDEVLMRYYDPKQKLSHLALHVRNLPHKTSREAFISSFVALEPYVPIKDDDEHVMSESQRAEAKIIAQNKHYNSTLRSDPTNVPLWIEFMHVQSENLEYESAKAKAKHRVLVLEKQISIWQRAMAANPTSLDLMELEWFLHMQRIDDNDIIQHLEQGATRFPENESIWLLLLQRKQLQFSTFSVTALRELYAQILQTLQMYDSCTIKS
ncbi:hypothetical protein THRCLA_04602 [Thraustotheca clavata]|uniref:Uncharacterized protein n=1 Tax=Thraustotheca clavata TaxID=74557 RepID=A0A1V9ZYK4_9STRA|nr:hypothetical protein THRCLA_04602 [Thraustotheca clavata]